MNNNILFILIIVGFIIGILFTVIMSFFDLFKYDLSDENYRLLLSTNAMIIATILAVSFSISLFAIQHALGNYAPSLLRYYITDKATILSFIILSSSAIFNLYALIINLDILVLFSIFTAAYSFITLAYYYFSRSQTIDSISLITNLKNKTISYIENDLEDKFEKSFKKYLKNPQFSIIFQDQHLQIMKNNFFHNGEIIKVIQNNLNHILVIIDKNALSSEKETALYGFDSVCNIIEKYIDKRRESTQDKLISYLLDEINK